MLPFAYPYPPEQANGFWGVPTSTIDWCEENYVVSPYIAEALNTVTNSGFMTAYGLMNAAIIVRSYRLTKHHVPDKKSAALLNRTMVTGVSIFALGYILWNMDIHLCEYARATRREWGMPYGFVLEGHGWWHLLTGTGVYFYLVYEEYLRCWLTGTQMFYSFEWAYCLPVVILKDPSGLEAFRSLRDKKEI
ncbi:hypothetical protein OXX80_010345 [Metschnikowia pulcherrima]